MCEPPVPVNAGGRCVGGRKTEDSGQKTEDGRKGGQQKVVGVSVKDGPRVGDPPRRRAVRARWEAEAGVESTKSVALAIVL